MWCMSFNKRFHLIAVFQNLHFYSYSVQYFECKLIIISHLKPWIFFCVMYVFKQKISTVTRGVASPKWCVRKSERGSPYGGSGVNGVNFLRSRHFLALNIMTKNPTFSTKNQAFKKWIEKQNTENRIIPPRYDRP